MPDPITPPATGDGTPTPTPTPAPTPAPAPEPTPAGDEGQLGDAGKKALDAERAARKVAEKAAADALAKVKEFEDATKSEAEKLAERATTAEAKVKEAESKALRLEVALEKNVPAELRDFLTGDTREELETKADTLLAHLKPGGTTPKPGSFDGGARPGEGDGTNPGGTPDLAAQIKAAEAKGDKTLVLTLKARQLAQKMVASSGVNA